MKKFTINCDFGGQMAPFTIYIGEPEPNHHPLHFQADWLTKQRGGTIPPEVMDAVAKLKTLAEKNGVPLEELCVYALGAAQDEMISEGASEEASEEGEDGELVSESENVEESEEIYQEDGSEDNQESEEEFKEEYSQADQESEDVPEGEEGQEEGSNKA